MVTIAQEEFEPIEPDDEPFEPIEPDDEPFEPIEPDPDLGEPRDKAGGKGYGATPDMTEENGDG